MRVDYRLGLSALAKRMDLLRAHRLRPARRRSLWWRQRSPDPVPDTAERAVEIADSGGIAIPEKITVRSIAGEQFDRIVGYELGPLPEAVSTSTFDYDDEKSRSEEQAMSEHTLIEHPLRWIVRDIGADAPGLCCPLCGMDFVHPEQVAVDQGKTRTIVRCESTNVSASSREATHRGSLISLDFWCENGHVFRYLLEFHKGQMHCELYAGNLGDRPCNEELWRS